MDNQIVNQLTWKGSSIKEYLYYFVYKKRFPPEKMGYAISSVKDS